MMMLWSMGGVQCCLLTVTVVTFCLEKEVASPVSGTAVERDVSGAATGILHTSVSQQDLYSPVADAKSKSFTLDTAS